MPRKTDRRIILQAYQLRQQDLSIDEIVDRLDAEFSPEFVPDRSTVARHLKHFEAAVPGKLQEDQISLSLR